MDWLSTHLPLVHAVMQDAMYEQRLGVALADHHQAHAVALLQQVVARHMGRRRGVLRCGAAGRLGGCGCAVMEMGLRHFLLPRKQAATTCAASGTQSRAAESGSQWQPRRRAGR